MNKRREPDLGKRKALLLIENCPVSANQRCLPIARLTRREYPTSFTTNQRTHPAAAIKIVKRTIKGADGELDYGRSATASGTDPTMPTTETRDGAKNQWGRGKGFG